MSISLVTGGAGFIGSHLVEALVAAGHRVRVLDDLSSGRAENLGPVRDRVEFLTGSVTDRAALRRAAAGARLVFHLAAVASVQRSLEDPLASHEACATGTLRVLEAAREAGAARVVYAASSSAYGDAPGEVRTEDDPLQPLSPYAAAKLAGEHYCAAFSACNGLETVRMRFFNVYGPRQDAASPYSGVIARFVAALAAGQAPVIYGDGQQSRDFVYVADAVQALLKAGSSPAAAGRVYNVGSGASTSIARVAAELGQLTGGGPPPRHEPARAGDVRHSRADISRAREELGYAPAVSLTSGLRFTLDSFRGNFAGERTGCLRRAA